MGKRSRRVLGAGRGIAGLRIVTRLKIMAVWKE